jgi:hypothetical protein
MKALVLFTLITMIFSKPVPAVMEGGCILDGGSKGIGKNPQKAILPKAPPRSTFNVDSWKGGEKT